uniref:Methyltransferase n=1 Tax=Ascaris lumbricoides TaxID=6252 RepID=A0A0M3I4W0_ASCLU
MVKVRFEKAEYEALKKFEKLHHQDIWTWIINKATEGIDTNKPLRILNITDEANIFALLLAEQMPTSKMICAMRSEMPSSIDVPTNVTVVNYKTDEELISIGPVDVILINELTNDVGDISELFNRMRKLFDGAGKLIILARPKNPPLPLPDVCLTLWRKLALTREEISDAAKKTEFSFAGFTVSVPITVPKFDWEAILFSGTIPVVKNTPKCTEKVITDFCKARPANICFEEKLSMFLLKTSDISA